MVFPVVMYGCDSWTIKKAVGQRIDDFKLWCWRCLLRVPKKAKWLSEKALQIAMNRREVKGKGEKKRHSHLNAEFQRIPRIDKKAFLRDECKETEENNRMGKTRGHFKKIRDAKGIFHAKMGTIKDRNGMDLTEAEDIKIWQEYLEELYKKDLHDQDNHDGVITHLQQDILECEVKWAWEKELEVKAGFRQGRGTRDQTANICWIIKNEREF